jgi:hypothetical protein
MLPTLRARLFTLWRSYSASGASSPRLSWPTSRPRKNFNASALSAITCGRQTSGTPAVQRATRNERAQRVLSKSQSASELRCVRDRDHQPDCSDESAIGSNVSTKKMRLRIPARCTLCGASGTIHPEVTIRRAGAILTWYCRACRHGWPLTGEEHLAVERRSGPDRRRVTRKDRRRS